ncbi:MAG TPA: hypothetical protein VFA45_15965 [Actinomycetes bacterium]|nr:hypothetical protein [Actinomycetes bacterium]
MTEQETDTRATPPECLVCPVCMGIAALRQSRPEAVEHVLKAGVELLAAFRALVDPADGDVGRRRPRSTGMQRIDVG